MSDPVVIALIGALTGTVNTVILVFMNGHLRKIKSQTNGLSEKLGAAEHALGKAEGIQQQKDDTRENI